MGARERLRVVERPGQLVVGAFEGCVVSAPHLQADLQCLFQALEALGEWREEKAEPCGLLFVPGGADSEHRPAAGEHVEGRHRLRQQAGLAVDDAGDEGEQLHPARGPGEEAEGRRRLEHLLFRTTASDHLEEMVHDAYPIEARGLGGRGDADEVTTERRRSTLPGEVGYVQAEFHLSPPGGSLLLWFLVRCSILPCRGRR